MTERNSSALNQTFPCSHCRHSYDPATHLDHWSSPLRVACGTLDTQHNAGQGVKAAHRLGASHTMGRAVHRDREKSWDRSGNVGADIPGCPRLDLHGAGRGAALVCISEGKKGPRQVWDLEEWSTGHKSWDTVLVP
jgi:hypothetical protein